jgi:mannan endo-1,6-alpha-mannosidase
MCGLKWNQDKYDGSSGVGQQMAAMEVTLACLIQESPPPATHDNGGTSQGNPGLGGGDAGKDDIRPPVYRPITAGDRTGAAILTIALLAALMTAIIWMMADELSEKTTLQQFQAFYGSATTAIVSGVAGAPTTWPTSEKGGILVSTVSNRSSASSTLENNRIIETSAVRIGHVRSKSIGNQRRLSNMPIGWPRQSTNIDEWTWHDAPEHPLPTWQGNQS